MIVRAARYLNVAPWELLQQNAAWTDMALAAMSAEHHASEQHQKRSARRQK